MLESAENRAGAVEKGATYRHLNDLAYGAGQISPIDSVEDSKALPAPVAALYVETERSALPEDVR